MHGASFRNWSRRQGGERIPPLDSQPGVPSTRELNRALHPPVSRCRNAQLPGSAGGLEEPQIKPLNTSIATKAIRLRIIVLIPENSQDSRRDPKYP
jgi:hypothetical protein